LTGIIEMGSIVPPQQMSGGYLVYLPQYMLSDDPAFEESDQSVHERCLSTLEKMYPHFRREWVLAIQTARAKQVMTLPTLNYSQRIPPVVSSLPGLYLLNSAQVTVGCLNVNEVIEIAQLHLKNTILQQEV
jgi:protoporphyrinogen oxidase